MPSFLVRAGAGSLFLKRLAGDNTSSLIPWAWNINGCASVINATLATLVAMQFGFTVLILPALLLYAAAVFNFP